jgi:hypothetical protein
MGYDLHITRAKEWSDNDDAQITAEEWLRVVAADPELSLAGYNGDYFALWNGPSRNPDPWFDWSGGNVMTKSPDPALVAKMIQLAERLGARVQGDDGEIYLSDGRIERDGAVDAGPEMDWRTW